MRSFARMRGFGFSADIVRKAKKGAGLSFSVVSVAMYFSDGSALF